MHPSVGDLHWCRKYGCPNGLLAVLIGVGAVGDLYYCRFDGCPQGLPTVFIGVCDLYCCRYGGCPHGLQVVLMTYTAAGMVDASMVYQQC